MYGVMSNVSCVPRHCGHALAGAAIQLFHALPTLPKKRLSIVFEREQQMFVIARGKCMGYA